MTRWRTAWHKVTEHSVYRAHCVYLLPMAGWFASSALLSAYNKYVFGQHGTVAFPCPLFLTSLHFGAQWIFATIVTYLWPETTGLPRVQALSWKEWLAVSVPCGVVTAADVGLSNLSMVQLSLTFYTMVKASTPIFVLFWAWIFQIERITYALVLVIAVIAVGEFLTVVGEVDFQWIGFSQCLVASVLSGARWTLVQLKLQTLEPPLKTSLVTMRVLAPSMFSSLLGIALIVERPWEHLVVDQAGFVFLLAGIGASIAIAMVLCEFMLILRASAIVLMIGGVLKELLNIGVGMAFFGDRLNPINTVGFTIVFGGVVLYKLSFSGPHAVSERAPVPATAERYGPVARSESELRPTKPSETESIVGNGHDRGDDLMETLSNGMGVGHYAPPHRPKKDHASDDGSYQGLDVNDEGDVDEVMDGTGMMHETASSDEIVEEGFMLVGPGGSNDVDRNGASKDGLVRLSPSRRMDSDNLELRENTKGTLA